jgi:putative ABC transport system permease protein
MKLYARLLTLLRGRDAHEHDVIREDAARLLDDAKSRGPGAVAVTWLALIGDLLVGGAQDLSRASRSLLRAPGFAITVALLLGLGVAATTTLFALVDAVILRPLPYPDPARLVMVWESNVPQQRAREGPSPGDLNDWVASNDAFEALTGWWTAQATLRGRDGSAPVTGVQVTQGFFEVFGRAALFGRVFTGEEYNGATSIPSGRTGGSEPVLVLSHRLWQSLGSDPALVGGTLFVEGRNWRVLGVMPPDFAMPDSHAAFWTPWDMRESYKGARFPDGPPREARFLRAVGRLKPGISREDASSRMVALAARIAADHPRTNENWSVELVPLHDEMIRSSSTGLLLVFGAVFGLLLLVCANVGSLSIARRLARSRETAIRLALGAGRPRLFREHVAESLLCAVLTALVAVLLTASSLSAAIAFAPSDIPRLQQADLSGAVIAFAIALSLIATIAGVFLPASAAATT